MGSRLGSLALTGNARYAASWRALGRVSEASRGVSALLHAACSSPTHRVSAIGRAARRLLAVVHGRRRPTGLAGSPREMIWRGWWTSLRIFGMPGLGDGGGFPAFCPRERIRFRATVWEPVVGTSGAPWGHWKSPPHVPSRRSLNYAEALDPVLLFRGWAAEFRGHAPHLQDCYLGRRLSLLSPAWEPMGWLSIESSP